MLFFSFSSKPVDFIYISYQKRAPFNKKVGKGDRKSPSFTCIISFSSFEICMLAFNDFYKYNQYLYKAVYVVVYYFWHNANPVKSNT